MLASVYLFGELGAGYTQYLDDHTRSIFKVFAQQIKANSQILIHREENTIYYAYIRRLLGEKSSNRYIGMCCAISGCLLTDYKSLFEIYESAISAIVARGTILEYTNEGQITSSISKLYQCKAEFAHVADFLRLQLDRINPNSIVPLPPIDFSINTAESRVFQLKDSKDEILKSVGIYTNVFILKNEDFDADTTRSYSNILRGNHKQILELQTSNRKLQDAYTELRKKQKRTKAVAWLCFLIAVLAFAFFCVWAYMNKKIKDQTLENDGLVTHVDKLQTDSTALSQYLSETTIELIEEKGKNGKLARDNFNLSAKVEEQFDTIQDLRRAISSKDDKISSLNSEISSLNSTIASFFSSIPKYVGASTTVKPVSYDANYRLWLRARKAVKIQSFWVKSDKIGTITIGLFRNGGTCIATETFRIGSSERYEELVLSNFVIPTAGDYYLAIVGDDVKLSYHESDEKEYNRYSQGNLQIIGVDTRSRSFTTKYYQYFYNIKYVD